MSRFLLVMTGALALQAAAAATPEDAVESLNSRLARIQALNEADLLSDERSARFTAAKKFIRERQCAAGTANPMVFMLPSKVNLTGSVGPSGAITISGVTSAESGTSAGESPPSAFTIPLRVSSLSAFPNEYLKDSAALLDTKGLPGDLARKLQGDVTATYGKLNARIQDLVNGYDPRACPKRAPGEAIFIFVPPTF